MPEVPCDCGANTALETIATYTNGGQTFEIDHLGIGFADTQWGEFVVYRDGRQIAEFAIEESALKPEFRPAELPVTTDELIRLAREAVAIEEAADILDG
jgi:hypothetical protein